MDGAFEATLDRMKPPRALQSLAPWLRLTGFWRSERAPLELQLLGRTLWHAALVGAAAGVVGAAFFAALEYAQKYLLESLAGYVFLRARGETFAESLIRHPFRPWLLLVLPATGALVAGWITRYAPETRGGGGDAMIRAFHYGGGVIRRRVVWIKMLASIFTLGSGGSGGREGPTMQIGGALGSTLGGALGVPARQRRILMIAGVAAGLAAVFRTPLGAALLAVEVLYRDDFESDALIPAVLASVVSYSVVISMYGETTLFAHAPSYPFHAVHLPLYGALAVGVALLGAVFAGTLHRVERLSARLAVPAWTRPALGGLALGVTATPLILLVGHRVGVPGQGMGILGGGYGAAQMAITGSQWLPTGWGGVELLLILCAAKLFASALTIGTGGSAGDFAPSLVIGALFGGAFGRAAQLLFHDPSIDPGAFALVGMGACYGGIAHVPVSSLVLVSELAGSYDLLVPLMLANGIAFVALQRRSLYRAQVGAKHESPVHRLEVPHELRSRRVGDVADRQRPHVRFALDDTAARIAHIIGECADQEVFPVVDGAGTLRGLISGETVRYVFAEAENIRWAVAADLMQPAVSLTLDDDLVAAMQKLVDSGHRELPVLDAGGVILGFLDDAAAMRAYLELATAPRLAVEVPE
jgi:CIC family chloride channel protein